MSTYLNVLSIISNLTFVYSSNLSEYGISFWYSRDMLLLNKIKIIKVCCVQTGVNVGLHSLLLIDFDDILFSSYLWEVYGTKAPKVPIKNPPKVLKSIYT